MNLDIKLSSTTEVLNALKNAQPGIKKATVPVMETFANAVAKGATARANGGQVRNLYRSKSGGKLHPKFTVSNPGTFWFRVSAAQSGATAKAQMLQEFSANSFSRQGKGFIAALNSAYGSKTGRILWYTHDKLDTAYVASMIAAVEKAAAEINKVTEA